MKKHRFFAAVCVALTLFLTSVGVFALQPPVTTPLTPEEGFWQNQPQDGSLTYQYIPRTCTCGVQGYSIVINHNIYMGDLVTIAPISGVGQIVYADIGAVAFFETSDPHYQTAHINGEFVIDSDFTNESETALFTIVPKSDIPINLRAVILCETARASNYANDNLFFGENIRGAAVSTIRTYALVAGLQPYYLDSLSLHYELEYSNSGFEEGYTAGYQGGYADGMINASQNADAFTLLDSVFGGVSEALNPILSMEIYGVSLNSLLFLAISAFVIMLIIKVVRG